MTCISRQAVPPSADQSPANPEDNKEEEGEEEEAKQAATSKDAKTSGAAGRDGGNRETKGVGFAVPETTTKKKKKKRKAKPASWPVVPVQRGLLVAVAVQIQQSGKGDNAEDQHEVRILHVPWGLGTKPNQDDPTQPDPVVRWLASCSVPKAPVDLALSTDGRYVTATFPDGSMSLWHLPAHVIAPHPLLPPPDEDAEVRKKLLAGLPESEEAGKGDGSEEASVNPRHSTVAQLKPLFTIPSPPGRKVALRKDSEETKEGEEAGEGSNGMQEVPCEPWVHWVTSQIAASEAWLKDKQTVEELEGGVEDAGAMSRASGSIAGSRRSGAMRSSRRSVGGGAASTRRSVAASGASRSAVEEDETEEEAIVRVPGQLGEPVTTGILVWWAHHNRLQQYALPSDAIRRLTENPWTEGAGGAAAGGSEDIPSPDKEWLLPGAITCASNETVQLSGQATMSEAAASSQLIVFGLQSGCVSLWNANLGGPVAVLERHTAAVTSAAITGGRWVITGSDNGEVQVYDLLREPVHPSELQPEGSNVAATVGALGSPVTTVIKKGEDAPAAPTLGVVAGAGLWGSTNADGHGLGGPDADILDLVGATVRSSGSLPSSGSDNATGYDGSLLYLRGRSIDGLAKVVGITSFPSLPLAVVEAIEANIDDRGRLVATDLAADPTQVEALRAFYLVDIPAVKVVGRIVPSSISDIDDNVGGYNWQVVPDTAKDHWVPDICPGAWGIAGETLWVKRQSAAGRFDQSVADSSIAEDSPRPNSPLIVANEYDEDLNDFSHHDEQRPATADRPASPSKPMPERTTLWLHNYHLADVLMGLYRSINGAVQSSPDADWVSALLPSFPPSFLSSLYAFLPPLRALPAG